MDADSDTAIMLPPEQSSTRTPCSFESAGWSCASTGYLWFSEVRNDGQYAYPCPQCNTDLFLAKAQRRARRGPYRLQCPCCGPGLAKGAYQDALDLVRSERFCCRS